MHPFVHSNHPSRKPPQECDSFYTPCEHTERLPTVVLKLIPGPGLWRSLQTRQIQTDKRNGMEENERGRLGGVRKGYKCIMIWINNVLVKKTWIQGLNHKDTGLRPRPASSAKSAIIHLQHLAVQQGCHGYVFISTNQWEVTTNLNSCRNVYSCFLSLTAPFSWKNFHSTCRTIQTVKKYF